MQPTGLGIDSSVKTTCNVCEALGEFPSTAKGEGVLALYTAHLEIWISTMLTDINYTSLFFLFI